MNNNLVKIVVDFLLPLIDPLPNNTRALLGFAFVGLVLLAAALPSVPAEQRLIGFLVIFGFVVLILRIMSQRLKDKHQHIAIRVKRHKSNVFLNNVRVELFDNQRLLEQLTTDSQGEVIFKLPDNVNKDTKFTVSLTFANYQKATHHVYANSPEIPYTLFMVYQRDKPIVLPDPPGPRPVRRRILILSVTIIGFALMGGIVLGVWTPDIILPSTPMPTAIPTPTPENDGNGGNGLGGSWKIIAAVVGGTAVTGGIVVGIKRHYETQPPSSRATRPGRR